MPLAKLTVYHALFHFQRMQLGIVLTSLQDNQHVATVLGLTASNIGGTDSGSPEGDSDDTRTGQEPSVTLSLQMAERLMKTILSNLAAHAVSFVFLLVENSKYELSSTTPLGAKMQSFIKSEH